MRAILTVIFIGRAEIVVEECTAEKELPDRIVYRYWQELICDQEEMGVADVTRRLSHYLILEWDNLDLLLAEGFPSPDSELSKYITGDETM